MKYIIFGKPVPWARPSHGQWKVYDTQKHTKLTYGITLNAQVPKENIYPLEGPVHLEAVFNFEMPKSAKKDNIRGTYHFYKPDTSNLVKLIEDVMTDIQFYKDDCQISKITAEKRWADEASTVFTITKL